MTLSEAHGRIDHLEKELNSIYNLLGPALDRVKLVIARIDESGQSVREGHLGRKAGGRMILDLLPPTRDVRGTIQGIQERCLIALKEEEL